LPDVFYPYENRLIPIELKHFVITEKFELRPTQYPMHEGFAKSNTAAFCFVLVEYTSECIDCDILVVPSRGCLGLHGANINTIREGVCYNSKFSCLVDVFDDGIGCLHDLFDTEIAKCFLEADNKRSTEGLDK
jgi:hypothetical protein